MGWVRGRVNRPQTIRLLYAELRRWLGRHVAAREVLEAAVALFDLYRGLDAVEPESVSSRPPFWAEPLDRAFSDGGWRVLAYEKKIGNVGDEHAEIATTMTREYGVHKVAG
jgi:hypothetical protein